MRKVLLETLGCVSVAMVIGAYFLGSLGYIVNGGYIHSYLNFIGGGLLIYYGVKIKSPTTIIANIIWALIAFYNIATKIF